MKDEIWEREAKTNMKEENLSIIIQYKTKNWSNEWKIINIHPEEYFDLDRDEVPEVDSVPVHNHAIDYITDCSDDITCTKIIIFDQSNIQKRIITTTYWNNQQNSITERVDYDNDSYDSEMILVIKNQENPSKTDIIRISKSEDILIPVYHGFFTDMEDGSEVENRIV